MTAPVQERFHALDAARGFALLLSIVLHATVSLFVSNPGHGYRRDRSDSRR